MKRHGPGHPPSTPDERCACGEPGHMTWLDAQVRAWAATCGQDLAACEPFPAEDPRARKPRCSPATPPAGSGPGWPSRSPLPNRPGHPRGDRLQRPTPAGRSRLPGMPASGVPRVRPDHPSPRRRPGGLPQGVPRVHRRRADRYRRYGGAGPRWAHGRVVLQQLGARGARRRLPRGRQ